MLEADAVHRLEKIIPYVRSLTIAGVCANALGIVLVLAFLMDPGFTPHQPSAESETLFSSGLMMCFVGSPIMIVGFTLLFLIMGAQLRQERTSHDQGKK
jgi:hypothetical protein